MPAVEQCRYRNKLEYSFGEDEDGKLVLGFHRAGRWDLIDDVDVDILASERVDEVREAVKAWCREEGLTAWDRESQTGLLRNLVVREGRRTGQIQARLVTGPGSEFRAAELAAADAGATPFLWTRAEGVAETTRERRDEGDQGPRSSRRSCRACASASRRTRSSRPTPRWRSVLYGAAAEFAGLTGREKVLDLFCGIGTIALVLALDAGEVWGVELVEEAVADAIENAKLNGIDNTRFFAGDVRLGDARAARAVGQPGRGRGGPAARRPVTEGRAPHHRGGGAADRLRLVQPDHARAERAPARGRRRLRARDACARSTCSRRRRTSSAWRCWSAASPDPPSGPPRRRGRCRGRAPRPRARP